MLIGKSWRKMPFGDITIQDYDELVCPCVVKVFINLWPSKVECLFCSIVWKGSRLVKMALQCHMFETPHCTECETYRTITSIASNVFFGIPDISSRIDQSTMYGHTILNMYIENVCSNHNLFKCKCNTKHCLLLKKWSYLQNLQKNKLMKDGNNKIF